MYMPSFASGTRNSFYKFIPKFATNHQSLHIHRHKENARNFALPTLCVKIIQYFGFIKLTFAATASDKILVVLLPYIPQNFRTSFHETFIFSFRVSQRTDYDNFKDLLTFIISSKKHKR